MKNRFTLYTVSTALLLIILFAAIKGFQVSKAIEKGKAFQNPPPTPITATRVIAQDWQPTLSSTGSIEAVNGVDLNPEVAGIVKKIYFKSGDAVTQGQPIITLDTDILSAQLEQGQAKLNLAKITYERSKKLLAKQAASESVLDADEAAYKAAKATVAELRARLEQKTLRAPFDGHLGIRRVHLGQFINNATVVTSLQSVNPIYVNFTVSERDANKIHLAQDISLSVGAYPGYHFKGKVNAIDSKINANNKSLSVQASIPNEDKAHNLIPGMFAEVEVQLPARKGVLVVPDTALTYTLYGDSVFMIDQENDNTVTRTYVTTGKMQDDLVEIVEGLEEGDLIVKEGQLKLHDGMHVAY